MSNKTSDKRYRITLTRKQFDLIGHAVDIMLGMAAISGKNKSENELEYETIYSAIRNFEVALDANVATLLAIAGIVPGGDGRLN